MHSFRPHESCKASPTARGRSKLLAEKRAYELCGEQSQWSLVTIQPPVVQGPPPGMSIPCVLVGLPDPSMLPLQ